PRRGQRRHGRHPGRLLRPGRPRARLGLRLPRCGDLAAGPARARRPRLAAPHDRALGRRGHGHRARFRRGCARARRGRPAPLHRAPGRGMRLKPATAPGSPAAPAGVPRGLIAFGALAAAAFALVVAGVVRLPDLESTLSDLSDSLGAWTYLLVAGLAFLE